LYSNNSLIGRLNLSAVAVIGSGLIGRAWAISFARANNDVRIWSPTPGKAEAAVAYIEALLPDLAKHGLLRESSAESVRHRITVSKDLAHSVTSADYVQESAPEDVNIKRELFAQLDQLAPSHAILASSTSDIPASLFTQELAGRHRCVVVHPLNPPYLMPAVEVVPSRWTAPATVIAATDFMKKIGQSPIVMEREDKGFVTIRLQGALMQEAFRIVEEGLASPQDVDRAIRDGLAMRWAVVGPFETIDLNSPNGVREYVARYQPLYARLSQSHAHVVDWSGPVLDVVDKARRQELTLDQISQRQLWRDNQMMAVAALHQRSNA
jgi:L-gulonate 3-dehydrogenase